MTSAKQRKRDADSGGGLDSLQFELCGKGWKRKMTLFNEAVFEGRAAATAKRSMETILKPK